MEIQQVPFRGKELASSWYATGRWASSEELRSALTRVGPPPVQAWEWGLGVLGSVPIQRGCGRHPFSSL